jgi:hypothetical protein
MATKAKTPAGGPTKQTGRAHRQHTTEDGLRKELQRFVAEHPQGWDHEQWLGLVESLRGRGHSVDDPDRTGTLLERERLAAGLKGIPGVGSHRIQTLADRYGSIWNLRSADATELAQTIKAPRSLAERIQSAVTT